MSRQSRKWDEIKWDGRARSLEWLGIANAAQAAGLESAVVRAIASGRCPVDAVDALVGFGSVDAKVWAPVRQLVTEEHARLKRMNAARAREWRARQAKVRIETDRRSCATCGKSLKGQRADARFCSPVCRVRFSRKGKAA
jgi:hypothetical protein